MPAIFLQGRWRGEALDGELSKMDILMNEDIEEDGDFLVNEKDKHVLLTAQGVKKVEGVLPYRQPGRSGESRDPAQYYPGASRP